ncbi:hypothetical protein EGT07_07580 [Herbaspirillum sp. HC18]|nr:hypothetical protein EGT07_07580 [Herbaspirillum sp. HC18]
MGLPAFTISRFRRLHESLFADRPALFSYGLAALLAIVFIAYLFPVAFLAGHGAFFESGDASQHVAGWQFYARDEWHFPLLHTQRLNHPDGVNIAFTDSIPLAALLFKLAAKWLPEDFHYIGLWHAVAFLIQGLAAAFLIRVFEVRHALGTVCAVFFALTWPALLWRMGHPSLMTHGIVLCAFALYFMGRQGKWSGNAASSALVALSIAGLTVHPYFFAFCYPLFLAFLVEQALAGEGWKIQLARLLASVVAIAAIGAVLGYFSHGGTTTFGYGYYSMNLTAPFCGGKLISCAQETLRHEFSEFRFADATGGQYEGYNYFGAGVLLLVPFAVAARWRDLPFTLRRYPVLLLTLLLFAAYAVTNLAYFGAHEVLSFPLPAFLDKLTGTFRASGRFFWPVGYVLLFTTLTALLKKRSTAGMLLLVLAMPLQWADVKLLRERIMRKASAPSTGEIARWSHVMSSVDKINLYPAFGCGDVDVNVYWFFQRLAADYGKLLDTGYIARPNVDCEANKRAFAGRFEKGRLYVMPADYLNNPFVVPDGFQEASTREECVKWRITVVCQAGSDRAYWARSGLATESLAPLKAYGEWSANALHSQIGTVQNGRLIPAEPSQPGVLSFGPYIILPAGRYHYTIDYVSRSDPSQQVGRWDVVMDGAAGAVRELAAGPMYGTEGAPARIEGTFTSGGAKEPLEIRTFFAGHGDLQVAGIVLKKMSQ